MYVCVWVAVGKIIAAWIVGKIAGVKRRGIARVERGRCEVESLER